MPGLSIIGQYVLIYSCTGKRGMKRGVRVSLRKSPNGLNSKDRIHDQEESSSPGSPPFSFSIVAENLSKINEIVPPGTRSTGISVVDADSIDDRMPERVSWGCS